MLMVKQMINYEASSVFKNLTMIQIQFYVTDQKVESVNHSVLSDYLQPHGL